MTNKRTPVKKILSLGLCLLLVLTMLAGMILPMIGG